MEKNGVRVRINVGKTATDKTTWDSTYESVTIIDGWISEGDDPIHKLLSDEALRASDYLVAQLQERYGVVGLPEE